MPYLISINLQYWENHLILPDTGWIQAVFCTWSTVGHYHLHYKSQEAMFWSLQCLRCTALTVSVGKLLLLCIVWPSPLGCSTSSLPFLRHHSRNDGNSQNRGFSFSSVSSAPSNRCKGVTFQLFDSWGQSSFPTFSLFGPLTGDGYKAGKWVQKCLKFRHCFLRNSTEA